MEIPTKKIVNHNTANPHQFLKCSSHFLVCPANRRFKKTHASLNNRSDTETSNQKQKKKDSPSPFRL